MESRIIEDEEDMDEPQQPKIPESFIQVVFKDANSIEYDLQFGAKTKPIQVMAIAEYLRVFGEAGIMQEQIKKLQDDEMRKIEVPKGHFNK